ncbi:MAG: ribonuclease P protein component [Sciscionella sp.]
MLTRSHRLRASRDFARTIRSGRRAGTATLVVHLTPTSSGSELLVGLVVSKAVGNAVTRNRVKRRLRELVRERLRSLPASGMLVIRALPTAAAATSARLGADLDAGIARLWGTSAPRRTSDTAS